MSRYIGKVKVFPDLRKLIIKHCSFNFELSPTLVNITLHKLVLIFTVSWKNANELPWMLQSRQLEAHEVLIIRGLIHCPTLDYCRNLQQVMLDYLLVLKVFEWPHTAYRYARGGNELVPFGSLRGFKLLEALKLEYSLFAGRHS